jgi:hypothetical protein
MVWRADSQLAIFRSVVIYSRVPNQYILLVAY